MWSQSAEGRTHEQGSPMKQSVLAPHHDAPVVELERSCDRPRRTGERKRKSVCSALWMPGLNALNLVIVKIKKEKKITLN